MTDKIDGLPINVSESSFSSSLSETNEEKIIQDTLQKLEEEEISSGIDEDEFDAKLFGIKKSTSSFQKESIKIYHQDSQLNLTPITSKKTISLLKIEKEIGNENEQEKEKEKEKGWKKEKEKKKELQTRLIKKKENENEHENESEKETSNKEIPNQKNAFSGKKDLLTPNQEKVFSLNKNKPPIPNRNNSRAKRRIRSTPISKKDEELIKNIIRNYLKTEEEKEGQGQGQEQKKEKEKENKKEYTQEKASDQKEVNFYQNSNQDLICEPLRIKYLVNENNVFFSKEVIYYYEMASKLNHTRVTGTLVLTNYKLFFFPSKWELFRSVNILSNPIIPLGNIARISKFNNQSFGNGDYTTGITIHCKNFQVVHFYYQNKKSRKEMLEMLFKNTFPLSVQLTFAYKHKKNHQIVDKGWLVYQPRLEFQRQGLPNENWKLSKLNAKYSLCSTYPQFLVFPKSMSNNDISVVSKYRSKGRLQILTWIHPKNGASITRSSQPKVGITQKACEEDQKMMKSILQASPNSKKLYIMDCRPKKNAMANRAKGAGYETIVDYPNCSITFLGIDNIHVMRESLNKIKNLCRQSATSGKKWLSALENTGWFSHIQKILYSSVKISKLINEESQSILVHCSDGWDRTAQICSFVQIFLDPYFRTIEGFEVLIEKEWLSFGHKFHQRIGQANSDYGNSQRSPVFLQWVDCVFQCINQFPTVFEFNEQFLIFILEHLFSLRFGTFLFNNDKERKTKQLSTRTYSLWTYINQNKKRFVNPFYQKKSIPIYPEYNIRGLLFWDNYYMKYLIPDELEKRKKFQKIDFSLEIKLQKLKKLSKEEIKLKNKLKKLETKLNQLKKN
ncbi:myotubularin-related [Anaeramoeba flamelloides]|uniref:Myotubularin-related n=1 Tax=Anaeramoeba flamelloides TaxID=1746091 RepID=A0AAV7YUA8_9EUKA|nr:myotubularin-related [Anaeramoeba flamelloides]